MIWFLPKIVPSIKNGQVRLYRRGGTTEVYVNDCGQTTPYTNEMWSQAFNRLTLRPVRPSILLLGLGGGGSVPLLHKYFPDCKITAVEYDPVMVTIARDVLKRASVPLPEIHEMDAADYFKTAREPFDIIIVDLFSGPEPSPLCTDAVFLQKIDESLTQAGILFINVYKRKEYLGAAKKIFPYSEEWAYRENHLAAFRKSVTACTPPETWPEFGAIADPVNLCRRERVGTGIRWSLWPVCFERYVGDLVPDLHESKKGALSYNRLVVWDRLTPVEIPPGWHQTARGRPWRIDGIFQLSISDYTSSWHKKARHDVRRWREDVIAGTYTIEEVSFDTFAAAYRKSLVVKKAGSYLLQALERKQALTEVRSNTIYTVVRDTTGEIIAGTALHYSPTYSASVRECPFMLPQARSAHAMTGLMDYWFADARRRGIRTLYFSYYWQPGDPKDWKGFSLFKSHFIQQYVVYPPTLWRFERGKFI